MIHKMDPGHIDPLWLTLLIFFFLVLGPENLGKNMNLQNQQINTPPPQTEV